MFATTTNDTVNPSSNEHRIIPTHPHKHRKKVMKTNTNIHILKTTTTTHL